MDIPIEQHDCAQEGCGVSFWITVGYGARRRQDKKGFYCPNGHSLFYKGETDAQIASRLRLEKGQLEIENNHLMRRINRLEHPRKRRKAASHT